MLAIVNRRASEGRCLDRWRRVERELAHALGPFMVAQPASTDDMRKVVAGQIAGGERHFLAAGGDGTVNALVNALVRSTPDGACPDLVVGAVGLGSSNDFHKPYRRVIAGAPCRIDFDRARPGDVGCVEWAAPSRTREQAYWVVNASLGTTAAANWTFNHPGRFLRVLKRTSTDMAIACAATGAILAHRAERVTMKLDAIDLPARAIRNLGIVKNPHFTGALYYDSPDEPDSGRFFVHGLDDVSLPRMISILAGLSRGRFSGAPGTWSSAGRRLSVKADGRPFALEFDGEVVRATAAEFSLLPRRLRFCP